VAAAVAHWHTSHGLPAPSHTERRSSLIDKMKELFNQGKLIRDIAKEVGMCTRSVTLLLGERFRSLGQQMPDGRKRRALLEQRKDP
jgi:hypothetical protein